MFKKYVFFLNLLFFSTVFFSCSKNNSQILFDSSLKEELSPQKQFAVVISPYTAIYENTEFNSLVTGHGRKGDVFEVIGNRTTKSEINESEMFLEIDENKEMQLWNSLNSEKNLSKNSNKDKALKDKTFESQKKSNAKITRIYKWICVKDGWILASDVEIYQNKLRAISASSKL